MRKQVVRLTEGDLHRIIKELPDKNFGIGGNTIDKVKAEYVKKQKENK